MCKSILFIAWFFYSSHFCKQRKVTEIKRLTKWFMPLIFIYIVFVAVEVFFGTLFIKRVLNQQDVAKEITDKKETIANMDQKINTVLAVIYSIYVVAIIILTVIFTKIMNRYSQSMIDFHAFLTNYRQTPRSRFIRKYQPQQEPIFEENSMFEKSVMSSQPGFNATNLDLTSLNNLTHN